jgi:hypothetical protein
MTAALIGVAGGGGASTAWAADAAPAVTPRATGTGNELDQA